MKSASYRIILVLLLAGLPSVPVAQSDDDAGAAYSRKGADTCIACHDDDALMTLFRSKHGVKSDSRSPFGHGQLQCEACHGPGGEHAGRVRRGQERPGILNFGSDSGYEVEQQNAMCLDCHGADMGASWHNGAHPPDEVACGDCHESHAARDSVMQTELQPEVCFDCHRTQRSESLRAFAHPFFEGQMDCTSCHGMHEDTVATTLVRDTVNDTCQQCHAEKRGPYLWEHAPVSEDCGLCHAPHGSNHPGMLTKRAPLLCQSCHSQSGHPSLALESSDIAGGAASRFLTGESCLNCHSQAHGSNHPSGSKLMR